MSWALEKGLDNLREATETANEGQLGGVQCCQRMRCQEPRGAQGAGPKASERTTGKCLVTVRMPRRVTAEGISTEVVPGCLENLACWREIWHEISKWITLMTQNQNKKFYKLCTILVQSYRVVHYQGRTMKNIAALHTAGANTVPTINFTDPLRWLSKGWRDFRRTPILSGAYGLTIAGLFYATTYAAGQVPVLVMSFITGFLLIAPFLATGIYELSRRLERDEQPSLSMMLATGRHNFWSIASFGIALALILLAWGRLTGIMFALSFPNLGPENYLLTWDTVFSSGGLYLFVLVTAVSLILGAVTFAMSAVSLPLLIDKPVDVITAVATSVRSVLDNLPAMTLWAVLIALLTALGVATLYIGLAITLPLVAHATWHAYRSLVR